MFIERLINQGNAPLLEQVVQFTGKRHSLIAENIANVDTTDYRQKDLSVKRFQGLLGQRVKQREKSPPGLVRFDDITSEVEKPQRGILAHDRNNRSMEQLMSDMARNAMLHNMAVEILRKQYSGMEMALKERIT